MKAVKLIAVAVAMALVGVSGFAIGGRLGFYEGYLVATYTESVVTGALLLRLLSLHDRGECEAGREMLELMVDGALIDDWYHHDLMSTPPFYAPPEAYEIDLSRSLLRLAEYRAVHPHQMPEPVASTIQATVTRLSEPQ
jgi:hypothetical protein